MDIYRQIQPGNQSSFGASSLETSPDFQVFYPMFRSYPQKMLEDPFSENGPRIATTWTPEANTGAKSKEGCLGWPTGAWRFVPSGYLLHSELERSTNFNGKTHYFNGHVQ